MPHLLFVTKCLLLTSLAGGSPLLPRGPMGQAGLARGIARTLDLQVILLRGKEGALDTLDRRDRRRTVGVCEEREVTMVSGPIWTNFAKIFIGCF